jgi:hypothetical protein
LTEASQKTVALVVDLGEAALGSSEVVVKGILKDPKFQKAVAAALKAEGQAMMADQTKGRTTGIGEATRRLGGAAGKAALAKSPVAAQRVLQKSPGTKTEYQRVERGLKELTCAYEKSPIGVFVSRNNTWLIIVGSVAALGGAAGMYVARAGDFPAKAFSLLENIPPIKLGSVSLSANRVNFVPSERKVDLGIKASAEWKRPQQWQTIKANFQVQMDFKNDQIAGVAGKAELFLPLSPSFRATGALSGSMRKENGGQVKGALKLGLIQKLTQDSNLQYQLILDSDDNVPSPSGERERRQEIKGMLFLKITL